MAYTGSLLPAFGNLPIYNAGAIVHVEPDPEPVDPEPTPIFATEFTGLTVAGPQDFFSNTACVYPFSGTDTETNFGPPTAAPVYANSGSGAWGVGYGVHVNSAQTVAYPFPTNNAAGVNTRHTTDIVDTTVRGEATKALRLKWLAPGARSNYDQQSWFMLWRSYSTALDFSELTIRFELKFPDLSTVLSYPPVSPAGNGRLTFFDYKTNSATQGGDFRITAEIVRTGASSYYWQFSGDNIANGINPILTPATYWSLYSTETIPQQENFTVEISIKRAYAAVRTNAYNVLSGANAGKARLRIRRESDSVTTWRTIADASESGIAAYNALNGTSWVNRHMGVRGFALNRLMHGNYGRKENVDCAVEIAKFRVFDSFDI
jgi:hypothetical protein